MLKEVLDNLAELDDENMDFIYIRETRFLRIFGKIQNLLLKQGYNDNEDNITLDILFVNEMETLIDNAIHHKRVTDLYLRDEILYWNIHDNIVEFIQNKTLYACEVMKNPYFEKAWDIIFFVDRQKKKKKKKAKFH